MAEKVLDARFVSPSEPSVFLIEINELSNLAERAGFEPAVGY